MRNQGYVKKVNQYQLERVIGSGSFALVYVAFDTKQEIKVAIKEIDLEKYDDEENVDCLKQKEYFQQEIEILKNTKHPNIIELKEMFEIQNHLYLVFEYCSNGDLDRFMKKQPKQRLPEKDAKPICLQFLDAFKLLNKMNIVHRDIKLANILINQENQIKIADFGFAKMNQQENLLQSFCGTPLTMAPEVLINSGYDTKCDIWSLGIIIYQIIYGTVPFYPEKADIPSLIKTIQTKKLSFPADIQISDDLKDLLIKMLVVDPKNRMSFEELFNHQWLKQYQGGQEKLLRKSKQIIENGLQRIKKVSQVQPREELPLKQQIAQQVQLLLNKRFKMLTCLDDLLNVINQDERLVYFGQKLKENSQNSLNKLNVTVQIGNEASKESRKIEVYDIDDELLYFMLRVHQSIVQGKLAKQVYDSLHKLMEVHQGFGLTNHIIVTIKEGTEEQAEEIQQQIFQHYLRPLAQEVKQEESKLFDIKFQRVYFSQESRNQIYEMIQDQYDFLKMHF